MLEFVQHSGCLDVPGAAACALARGKNEGGVPFVFDPHDITLHDDLWHAAFAGNVDIVTASVGPQHRNAVDELIGDVLDTGAMLTGGNVARVACAGTGTPQGNMAAWNTSDLDIMLQHKKCQCHSAHSGTQMGARPWCCGQHMHRAWIHP